MVAVHDASTSSAKSSNNTASKPTRHVGYANNPLIIALNGPTTKHTNSTTSTPSARIKSTQKTPPTSAQATEPAITSARTRCPSADSATTRGNGLKNNKTNKK